MNPKTDISIYRTQGDTDPLIIELKVQNAGIITPVPSSANVHLNLDLATFTSIQAVSPANGVFSFDMSQANTANSNVCKFEVEVNADYKYVIGTGTIVFHKKLG